MSKIINSDWHKSEEVSNLVFQFWKNNRDSFKPHEIILGVADAITRIRNEVESNPRISSENKK